LFNYFYFSTDQASVNFGINALLVTEEYRQKQTILQWAQSFRDIYQKWAIDGEIDSFYLVNSGFICLFRSKMRGEERHLEAVLHPNKDLMAHIRQSKLTLIY
jgi:hypothetical protein